MLKLQEFLKEHPQDFRELLAEKPYAIKMQEDEYFILFKYSQIDSDFTNDLVRECRGIILDKIDWEVACHPFHKFGNYGESYVPSIDWDTVQVQEKLDGSLIKCWFNRYTGAWQWSTNGTIDAMSADLPDTLMKLGIENFKELIDYTLEKMDQEHIINSMDESFTYLFELCTPINKVVVPHKDYILYHLVTKHNLTGDEDTDRIGMIPQPKSYELHSLQACIDSANELPFNEEGYVVVDVKCDRVKVKSPAYLAVHHLRGEGVIVMRRVLDLIRANEHEEFLIYYEEYKDVFDEMEMKYESFLKKLQKDVVLAIQYLKEDRKTYASWATKQIMPSILFSFYDGKVQNVEEYLKDFISEKLLRYLKEF